MKSNLGMGVMIGYLGGNKSTVEAIKSSTGKRIKTVLLDNDTLKFEFTDGCVLNISDEGQSCCESRYMVTDDNLSDFNDSILLGFELKPVEGKKMEYGNHEIQFLDVKTDKGVFQMATHNEHNGYYGGFLICANTGNQ